MRPVARLASIGLFLVPATYLLLSTLSGRSLAMGYDAAFQPWTWYVVPWWLMGATMLAAWSSGRPWWQAVGFGLMSYPVWDTLWGILDTLVQLVQGGAVLRAYTRFQLSYIVSYKFLSDLGYLGTGFLLYCSGGRWTGLWLGPRQWGLRLLDVGLPDGGRSEGRSAFLGLVAVPLLILGSVGIDLATRGFGALRQSDETSVFANMTLYHAFLLSAAAAVGEELVYRGFLQTTLARWMPRGVAVVLQAVFFGFAHSGYYTWIHVLLPTLFGLVVGLVAWRFGIWMAISLHFLVDLYAFTAEATANQAWLVPVLNGAFVANLVLMLGWAGYWAWNRVAPRSGRPSD